MWTTKSLVSYQIVKHSNGDDYREKIGSVFEYISYPKFLQAWMAFKKSTGSKYSKRMIAKRLHCDPSFFGKILAGKKIISPKLLERVEEILGLNKKEREYFQLLVQFEKASSHPEKKYYLDRITRLRRKQIALVNPDQYEFYEKWYYSAVLQLLDCLKFTGDYQELAKAIQPPLRTAEAKKAIDVLERLGLIKKNAEGTYDKTDSVISTGEGWKSVAISNFQHETLDLAKNAMQKVRDVPKRFSTLTLSISEAGIKNIVEKFRNLEMECLEYAKQESGPDRVYQINLQAFPIAQVENANSTDSHMAQVQDRGNGGEE